MRCVDDEVIRKKGLASILVADQIQRSITKGASIMLISGDEKIYKDANGVECGNFPQVTFNT